MHLEIMLYSKYVSLSLLTNRAGTTQIKLPSATVPKMVSTPFYRCCGAEIWSPRTSPGVTHL